MAGCERNPLEEHITCSVCLDVYTDPHQLSCLHSFCNQCVQGLRIQDMVKCPVCRKHTGMANVKKDFKMESLILAMQKTTVEVNTETENSRTNCDVCKDSDRPVQWYCRNCEELLCSDCIKVHRGMKLTKSHKVIPINELQESKQQQFHQQVRLVREECTNIEKKIYRNRELINTIRDQQTRQVDQVERLQKALMKEVEKHHQCLIQQINCINDEAVEVLEQQGRLFTEAKQQLEDKLNFLSDVSQSQDFSVLFDTLQNLSEQIGQKLKQMQSDLPTFVPDLNSPVTVVQGELWDPRRSTMIVVDGSALVPGRKTTHHVTTNRRILTSQATTQRREKVLHRRYRQVKSVDIDYWPHKLCVHGNKIWVAGGSKGLFIYSLDFVLIRRVTHRNMRDITSVIKSDTDAIACDNNSGLVLLNQRGDYLNCLSQGHYSDACFTTENKLYALNFKQGSIDMFSKAHSSWFHSTQIILVGYTPGFELDKLCTTSSSVYVTSYSSHCLLVYSHTGELQYRSGMYGQMDTAGEILPTGQLSCPLLSDIDRGGNLLLCDRENHRLQAFDGETREWRQLGGMEEVMGPWCAGLGDKHLWVGICVTQKYKILKYEVASVN